MSSNYAHPPKHPISPPVRSRANGSTIANPVYLTLQTISAANRIHPTPFVVVVDIAILIWDCVARVKQNKTEFKILANASVEVAHEVYNAAEDQRTKSEFGLSSQLQSHVDRLLNVLHSVKALLLKSAGRSFAHRLFTSNDDLVKIADCRDQLDLCKRDFMLLSSIAIQATVERIEATHKANHTQVMTRMAGLAPARFAAGNSRTYIHLGSTHNVNSGGGTFNNIIMSPC